MMIRGWRMTRWRVRIIWGKTEGAGGFDWTSGEGWMMVCLHGVGGIVDFVVPLYHLAFGSTLAYR